MNTHSPQGSRQPVAVALRPVRVALGQPGDVVEATARLEPGERLRALAHVAHGCPHGALDRDPQVGQLVREAHHPGRVVARAGEALRAARPRQRVERAALYLVAVVVGYQRDARFLVVAGHDDVVHRVRQLHAQVVELLDVRIDHRRVAAVELLAEPFPRFAGVVGAAYVELDPEVLADAALEPAVAADEVQRRVHLGQLVVEAREPASEPERHRLRHRLVAPRKAVELEQVAEGAGAAVARLAMGKRTHGRGDVTVKGVRSGVRIAVFAVLLGLLCAGPAAASTSSVLVLDGKRVVEQKQRFAGASELAPPPAVRRPRAAKARAAAAKGSAARKALSALLESGQIDQATYDARLASIKRALRSYRQLTGTRRTELGAVIDNADSIAAAGALTPSRLAPVADTLDRNREWWATGPIPRSGQRVAFSGSELVWQYYRGQGIELQMLANFAKVNSLWSSKKRTRLRALVDELVPLAADRGGAPAWEYYFRFGGGAPPWSSAISQGTAVQSLGRASQLLADPALAAVAERSLALFEQPPPTGVRRDTPDGAFYLIYSFAPKLLVLNADLQAVIGLYDFAQITGSARAQALYEAGAAEARVAVPRYDTGAWSLYSLERESDLSYHDLVWTFLKNLCQRTSEPVYCDTAARFLTYQETPPVVAPRTSRIRTGAPARIAFSLDKISRVGMTVLDSRGRRVLSTSAVVGHGKRFFTWSRPAKAGRYTLRLTATDLADNPAEPAEGTLRILKAPKKKRRR
jgi:hypothetical protein